MTLLEEIRDSWYLREPEEEYLFAKRREESGEYAWIAEHLDLNATDILLDIGCGTGVFLMYTSDNVSCAVGIDINRLMIRHASKILKGKAALIHGCAPQLPFRRCFTKVTILHSSFGTLLPNPLLWSIYSKDMFALSIEIIKSGMDCLKEGGKMVVVLAPGSKSDAERVRKHFISDVVSKAGITNYSTHIKDFNSIYMLILEIQG